jgi:hypothetical protein
MLFWKKPEPPVVWTDKLFADRLDELIGEAFRGGVREWQIAEVIGRKHDYLRIRHAAYSSVDSKLY